MSINRVNISGNLTRDPELRSMPSGTQVLSFSVAVNDRVRDQQSGEWKDRPNYVDCVLFGARAQGLSRFLAKGTKVAVEGKLHYSKWQAQDGSNRSKLEVYVDEVEFMSSRNQGQGAQPGYPQGGQQYQQSYQQPSYQQPQQSYQPQGYQQQPQPSQTFGSGNGGFAASVPPAPAQSAPASQPAPAAPQPAAASPAAQTPPSKDVYDEDIPF